MSDLTGNGTGDGFKNWSLIGEITNLDGNMADRLVTRARDLLQIYDLDTAKDQFGVLIAEAIYSIAEALFYNSINARAMFLPFTEEHIGSYRYRKAAGQGGVDIVAQNPYVVGLLMHLARNQNYVRVKLVPDPIGPVRGDYGYGRNGYYYGHDPNYSIDGILTYCSDRSRSAYLASGLSLYEWSTSVYGPGNGSWSW